MKLAAYLEHHRKSAADFAADLGEASVSGVRKWLSGERMPRAEQMRRIADATGGAVTPNDFILGDVEALEDDGARSPHRHEISAAASTHGAVE